MENVFSLLILEDNPDERFLLSRLLDHHFPQWYYYFVEDEKELLLFLSEGIPVSVLLLDIHLPGKDGLQILKDLRKIEAYRLIPVVGFSNSATMEAAYQLVIGGATTLFQKPVVPEETISLLRTLPAFAAKVH
ncbi:response regulator [Xanthocytophaga agilis]|uniref:Response regulator n=1 Tax=Xanthocytophaga agilis TaxID=3048010 RepID=A0AAE3RDW3_9BACT|nr:response regulator [Xanthocytophaga agilis]MDJ1506227.1 response regulator [Xanthocytophaga agilis]